MSDAARLLDLCTHVGTVVMSGSPDTFTGMKPQARVDDITSPCPICKMIKPGKIMKGSSTVFVNKKQAARVGDRVACGAGLVPPLGCSHGPAHEYSVRSEDNYVEAVFKDDSVLIVEPKKKKGPPEDVPEKKPVSFLHDLSLDLNIGLRMTNMAMGVGLNSIALGCFTVHIGG